MKDNSRVNIYSLEPVLQNLIISHKTSKRSLLINHIDRNRINISILNENNYPTHLILLAHFDFITDANDKTYIILTKTGT
jgi:hypothetical protein